jgi:gamma-glutamylcyclotransferase (GGCT)/AIG2-like uncharacterized protein YtfP
MGKSSKRKRSKNKFRVEDMVGKKFMLVYGSLREGQYNYERFNRLFPGGLKKLNEVVLGGYKMYSLYNNAYPCCIFTGESSQEVTFDLMEVSPECYEQIDGMEKGAGYEAHTIDQWVLNSFRVKQLVKATVYLFNDEEDDLDKHFEVVESGNWIFHQVPQAIGSWRKSNIEEEATIDESEDY